MNVDWKRAVSGLMIMLVMLLLFVVGPGLTPPAAADMVYWSNALGPDNLRRANLDGSGAQTLVSNGPEILDVEVDPVAGKVYYSEIDNGRIMRMNLDGSNLEVFLSGLGSPSGIFLDNIDRKIYWADTGPSRIRRADLDGSNIIDVITAPWSSQWSDMAVDHNGGKIYWSDNDNSRICRANLDGSSIEVIINSADDPRELALDTASGFIYWVEEMPGNLRRAALDGTGITTLVSGINTPFGIALDLSAGQIYYGNSDDIQRRNLDGTNAQFVTATMGVSGIAIAPDSSSAISGTIFEDTNYGGGSGRNLLTSLGIGRPNVRVELYDSAGNFLNNTITASDGSYSFAGLAAAIYTVRVVDSTVTSSRSGSTGAEVAVQTFRVDGTGEAAGTGASKVGGEQPQSVDAPANSGSQTLADQQAPAGQHTQSVVSVNVSGGNVGGVDFGFSFDTIVNTNDSGQGSLRQFILNSNLLGNVGLDQDDWGIVKNAAVEHSIFMIPQADSGYGPDPTGGSGNAFVIRVSSTSLPDITDVDTAIDGRTQKAFAGDTNGVICDVSTGPEVVVDYGGTVNGYVFHFQSVRGHLYNIGVYRGGDAANNKAAVCFDHVSTSGSNIFDLTVYQSSGHGVQILASSGLTFWYNVLRGNGTVQTDASGLLMENSPANKIEYNSIVGNAGHGIALVSGTCDSNMISSNTIEGNGQAGAGSGIGLFAGSNNKINNNTITANADDGIVVLNGSNNNFIIQNSIYANGGLGIDLCAGGSYDGDGVTANDPGDSDTGGNALLNFPVITSVTLTSGIITVNFDLDAPAGNYQIEFFKNPTSADPSGYGEGETFAAGVSITHTGGGTRSFSHSFAGAAGDIITATATVDLGGGNFGATSEFSGFYTATAATPAIVINKSAALISDPLNGGANPIIVPGAVMQYSVTVTNQGLGRPDSDTVIITNPVGSENMLFVGDLAGPGSGPVSFTDGAPASGLIYTFSGLSSTSDNLSFSNDNGVTYTYTPVPDANGYDANVTQIRVRPSGTMAPSGGSNDPGFTLQFNVKVR